jgi:hypothetical protein
MLRSFGTGTGSDGNPDQWATLFYSVKLGYFGAAKPVNLLANPALTHFGESRLFLAKAARPWAFSLSALGRLCFFLLRVGIPHGL